MTLLSSSNEGAQRIAKCRRRATGLELFSEAYLGITNCHPRLNSTEEVVDVLSKRCDVDKPVMGKHHVEVGEELSVVEG